MQKKSWPHRTKPCNYGIWSFSRHMNKLRAKEHVWKLCVQHILFENIFFSSVSTTPFALLARWLNLLRIRNVKDFLIKVSNIGTYKTYSYTKANTINFCNIDVVQCLRNIHFDYIVYHSNEKQNMKACFNLVLCTMLVTFLTDVKRFLRTDASWARHFCFCVSEYQPWFHRQFSDLFAPDLLSSPLCMWQ